MLPFPAPARPQLRIFGTAELFPVRRIYCVGRNYAEHAREMGVDPNSEPPVFFSKPADAVTASGQVLPFPPMTQDLHHEAELVVAIGASAKDVAPDTAEEVIWGYAAGNDLTRRDLQSEAKSRGGPWDMSKGFDNSAVMGALHPVSECGHIRSGRITAEVDGVLRQDGEIADMIWPIPNVIAHLSRYVSLEPGDLIMTGTPAGVGPLQPGQSCTVRIDGLSEAVVRYAP
ncbi:fumarylacetoacetate hydrolase family protein [Cognatishimia sp. SS12]|uniref:fumarylacetoacetate hydrolase family protein n=1 Tax=Cognatishimia sp. SS12 TaxID=2979465 RepID=UPI002331523A|nr:fumarylacetoacetate hydrolase family protein [Cognatishimia sp. SS12]MDC0739133.1 fumarylacetoacetate hydrolase family protein [Cognatishimia sp. SS12]